MSRDPFNPTIFGLSPLGNNCVSENSRTTRGFLEGPFLVDGFLSEVSFGEEDDTIREVPLVYDSISCTWCAKLSKINQEDREVGLEVARLTNEDQTFLSNVGYTQ